MGSVVTKFCGLCWMIYTRWSARSGMMCLAVKLVYKDTEWATESVRIKRVEFRENIRAFSPPPQGQSKLSVKMTEVSVKRGLTPVLVLYMFKSVCGYWALTVIVFLRPKMTHVPTNCGLAILMKRPVIKKKKRKRISAVLLLRGHRNGTETVLNQLTPRVGPYSSSSSAISDSDFH